MAFRFLWYLILNCATFMWYQELMLRRCGRGRFSMTLVNVILGFYIPGLGNVQETPPSATLVKRSPRYYGHCFWPPGKMAILFLVKKKPSLIWSPINKANFSGLLLTVLTGFHCTYLFILICGIRL